MQQEGTSNLFLLFFSWWYKYLPYRLFSASSALFITLTDLFSVKMILPTLFAPWKRDLISYADLSLGDKLQVAMLNLSSRFIGFLIKVSVFAGYLLTMAISAGLVIGCFAIWLSFPFVVIGLLILGIVTLSSGTA